MDKKMNNVIYKTYIKHLLMTVSLSVLYYEKIAIIFLRCVVCEVVNVHNDRGIISIFVHDFLYYKSLK